MKKPKVKKQNQDSDQPTEEEIKKLLFEAGFVFVENNKRVFGKPEKDLHKGETIIFPEGSNRGIPVK